MAKIDFKFLLPFLAKIVGQKVQGAKVYKDNKELFDILGPQILEAIQEKLDKDEHGEPVALPPVLPADEGPALPKVPQPPPVEKRVVSGLRLKYFFFEEEGQIKSKPEFDAILSGSDALNARKSKIHVDIDPLDAKGEEIGPGSPELAQLLKPNGETKLQYRFKGSAPAPTTHQWHRDFGCTPVFKNHFDAFEDNVEYDFSVQAFTEDGLESNWAPVIRIKR